MDEAGWAGREASHTRAGRQLTRRILRKKISRSLVNVRKKELCEFGMEIGHPLNCLSCRLNATAAHNNTLGQANSSQS